MTRRPRPAPRPRRPLRGASLIEFVIVFPVAVLLVLGMIQMGMIYMARITLNHAVFMAAREGAMHHASASVMREALARGLLPFYQDNTNTNPVTRLLAARARYTADSLLHPPALQVLNPSPAAFQDFGVTDPATKAVYIPNDNLQWRSNAVGSKSKLNIRDANLLKVRVVYGYEMKVPLVAGIIRRVMCGGSIGVDAWGNIPLWQAVEPASTDCLKYYLFNRMPIESTAIVEMQSAAYRP